MTKKILFSLAIGALLATTSSTMTAAAASYTADQVAAHNNQSDCWTIINNQVYDITAYIPNHPGGVAAIIGLCGHDGTTAFSSEHSGGNSANSALASYYIGDLAIPDTTAPNIPSNLTASAASTTQINLSWTAATDNVGVTGYTVIRDGSTVGTSTTTAYQDLGLTASTTYSYAVTAADAAGNVSAASNQATATTTPADNHNDDDDEYGDKGDKHDNGNHYGQKKQKQRTTDKYNKKIDQLTEKYNKAMTRLNQHYDKKTSRPGDDD